MQEGRKLSDSQRNSGGYTQNVRYVLAKQKIDDLFLKFLSQPSTSEAITNILQDIKKGVNMTESMLPIPIFTSQKMSLQNSMNASTLLLQSPISKSPQKSTHPQTSPRSPIDKDSKIRKASDNSPGKAVRNMGSSMMVNSMLMQSVVVNKANYDEIPQFYFGEQLPIIDPIAQEEQNKLISELLGKKNEIESKDMKELTTQLLELPGFFSGLVFQQIDKQNTGKIQKTAFLNYWKNELQLKNPKERCFHVLKKASSDYIEREDLLPLMKVLLDTHPGLEFLRATPEFQDRYADTVIIRIFFMVNRRDNGRISLTEFNKSNLFQILQQVDSEEDINKIREYFSYEHFYVLYCKFWELDQDHDFLITKEEFSKYSGHALSRKTVDRIFAQVPRKFKTTDPTKMSYEDFSWFVLAEEDKTTLPSIEYWFRVIDLDENGIIAGYEMNYFFDEQRQRLEYLNHDTVLFEDIVCQMVDLLKPEDEIKFELKHFKAKQKQCGVFFNFLTNLNKLVSFETRDPFAIRNEIVEHPDYSDWDRFASNEYIRLAMEEENQENGEMFNDGVDPWDQDQPAEQQQPN